MNLEKMLEYQKIDHEIYKIELELQKSREMERVKNLKSQISLAENALLRLNKEASDLFAAIQNIEKDIASAVPDKGIIDNANTLEKAESAEKTLAACLESLANLEREARRAFDRLSAITKEAAKQYETGKYLSFEHKKARDEANALYIKVKLEQKDNFAKLAELTSQIEPKLLERYKALREQRRMPAIVAFNGTNCSACGMDISIEMSEKLKKSGDMAECPNCRRIVYLK
ncbi:MAG: hypothetical protein GX095_06405 [Clostridiales bacterium]|jgi:predicted  nucleic acid-binding Zn-ribbon protein|nr:hypothetical protein [Clostridiales bacterium]HOK81327.1 C4-type zinc ribbon domain-containing protein [Clostridia bacterium]HOL60446.1 C4-type zinc ribbon domain-containing protein [Clostridia bacterium]HPO53203.1 C4-type zinc ribbon domain-containing protein [Clostridia bacterium]